MTFVDSNVLIDILVHDDRWFKWSADKLLEATAGSGLVANAIVAAEVSAAHKSADELKRALAALSIEMSPIDEDVAFIAGRSFALWRRARNASEHKRLLADFMIGAHALVLGTSLLTRDPAIFRRYFSDLPLITPETHTHG